MEKVEGKAMAKVSKEKETKVTKEKHDNYKALVMVLSLSIDGT